MNVASNSEIKHSYVFALLDSASSRNRIADLMTITHTIREKFDTNYLRCSSHPLATCMHFRQRLKNKSVIFHTRIHAYPESKIIFEKLPSLSILLKQNSKSLWLVVEVIKIKLNPESALVFGLDEQSLGNGLGRRFSQSRK